MRSRLYKWSETWLQIRKLSRIRPITVLSFQPPRSIMQFFFFFRPLLSDYQRRDLVYEPYKSRRVRWNSSVSVWQRHGEGLHPEGRETGLRTGRSSQDVWICQTQVHWWVSLSDNYTTFRWGTSREEPLGKARRRWMCNTKVVLTLTC